MFVRSFETRHVLCAGSKCVDGLGLQRTLGPTFMDEQVFAVLTFFRREDLKRRTDEIMGIFSLFSEHSRETTSLYRPMRCFGVRCNILEMPFMRGRLRWTSLFQFCQKAGHRFHVWRNEVGPLRKEPLRELGENCLKSTILASHAVFWLPC